MITTIFNRSQGLKRSFRLLRAIPTCGVVLSVLVGCSNDPTGPTRDPRNTFTDWQHIQGKVSGVWTKDHNPHVITGPVTIEDGDSLVVKEGVQIVATFAIELHAQNNAGYLKMSGTSTEPVRWVLADPNYWGLLFTYGGRLVMDHVIVEGDGKAIHIGGGSVIVNSVFAESNIDFNLNSSGMGLNQVDSVILRSNIFAGFRPWDAPQTRLTQIFSSSDAYLDSSLTDIRYNLFYGPIGDSLPAGSSIVNVRYKGASGIRTVTGLTWPNNGNIYGNPQWSSYAYIGPGPTGISSNDYHLQSGSPALGTGADGGNIGAY